MFAHLFLVSEADSNVFWRLNSSINKFVDSVSAVVGRAEDMGCEVPHILPVVSIGERSKVEGQMQDTEWGTQIRMKMQMWMLWMLLLMMII